MPSKRPTIQTIADAAGVSIATVSYVLNGRDTFEGTKVASDTRDRVLAVADQFDYQPSHLARGIRRGRTDQVCLALDNLGSPWTQAMVDEVSRQVRATGRTTLLLVDGEWQRFLARRGADGAVITGASLTDGDHAHLRRLAEQGVALVVFEGRCEPDGFDVVRHRYRPALAAAMDLLTARHQRIAHLRRDEPGDAPIRYDSYRAGLRRAGIELDQTLVRDVHSNRDLAYRETLDLLELPNRPTAIFAGTDLAALSALWAAHRIGLRVPDELEIIGIGNTPEGQQSDPPLTSVGASSVFRTVAELLTARLTSDTRIAGAVHHCDWHLYERSTTRPIDHTVEDLS